MRVTKKSNTSTFLRSSDHPFPIIAGPCSIESYEMFKQISIGVKKAGATALRGGIFKMRTRTDNFQGLGVEAIEIVQSVKNEVGLPFVSEITDPRQIDVLSQVVDVFQVGTRNMHNYELLKELGRLRTPILLKRGMAAYLDEFLAASEYVLTGGNSQVILCERGIRTFEHSTRNTLDLAAIPYLKARTGLPVFVDPSHATGMRDLVTPMCWASAAAGADGLLIEVHSNPAAALSDGPQALTLDDFETMLPPLYRILDALHDPESESKKPLSKKRNVSQWMN